MRQLITIILLSVATVQADRMSLKEANQIVKQYQADMSGQVVRDRLLLVPRDIALALRIVARAEARKAGSNSPGFTR